VIRRSLAEILSYKRAIPVYVVPPAAPAATQAEKAKVIQAKTIEAKAAEAPE
jgi:hypothetical protein